jgi:universal stress protein A
MLNFQLRERGMVLPYIRVVAMKVKAGRSEKVILEMGAGDAGLPPSVLPELTLKRILLPVDFSESSRKALEYALSFARQFNAEMLLLHVIETVVPPSPEMVVLESEALTAKLHAEAAKRLSEWRKQVASQASVKAVVRNGISAHREIVDAARENNVDLIILGTHGRTGLAHLFIGSTAERVVRHAPCPVLVVRERQHDFVAESQAATTAAKAKSKGPVELARNRG